jgi:hypothetical protein
VTSYLSDPGSSHNDRHALLATLTAPELARHHELRQQAAQNTLSNSRSAVRVRSSLLLLFDNLQVKC